MDREQLKAETDTIISELPPETSWDELMYRIYVRQKIEKSLQSSKEDKVLTSDQIRKSLGMSA